MNKILAVLATIAPLLAVPAHAGILISGNVTTTGGIFQITHDIDFTITTTGTVGALIFDEWVTADGGDTSVPLSSFSYQINHGPTLTATGVNLHDNVAATVSDVTPNDGYLYTFSIPVIASDIFTLKAGTSAITSGSGSFNPQAIQNFTGQTFLTSAAGVQMSGISTAVPEPHEYGILAGGGLLTLAVWRRKKMALAR